MKVQIASKNINNTSIWLSVATMASKYPSLSPYVYCANNPIKLVDPDGMELDVYIIRPDSKKATEALNKSSSLTIIRNDNTGKLSASGKAKNNADRIKTDMQYYEDTKSKPGCKMFFGRKNSNDSWRHIITTPK